VDNSPGDAETEAIAHQFGVRYTVEPVQGLSRARNRGLEQSTTDIVAYLDDDAVPHSDWLEHLLSPFAEPKVGAVTGRIQTPESDNSSSEQTLCVDQSVRHWFEIATFGGLGLGSNMALRRSACVGHVIFSPRLGRGSLIEIAEENYAFAHLLSRGYRGVYLPTAVVTHPPLRHGSTVQEARNSFAYWLLLFSDFPSQRRDIVAFLLRRLRRQPLGWNRDAQDPGEIISSSWMVKLKAGYGGLMLYLRSLKL